MGVRKKSNGLKKLREKAGFSKIGLAEMSGVCVKTIQNIELRGMSPTLKTLMALAKALDVPVEWLI